MKNLFHNSSQTTRFFSQANSRNLQISDITQCYRTSQARSALIILIFSFDIARERNSLELQGRRRSRIFRNSSCQEFHSPFSEYIQECSVTSGACERKLQRKQSRIFKTVRNVKRRAGETSQLKGRGWEGRRERDILGGKKGSSANR